jgi:hypothetical protein
MDAAPVRTAGSVNTASVPHPADIVSFTNDCVIPGCKLTPKAIAATTAIA